MMFETMTSASMQRCSSPIAEYVSYPCAYPYDSLKVNCSLTLSPSGGVAYMLWLSDTRSIHGNKNIIVHDNLPLIHACRSEDDAYEMFNKLWNNPYCEDGLRIGEWRDASFGVLVHENNVTRDMFLPQGYIVKLTKVEPDRTQVRWYLNSTRTSAIPEMIIAFLEQHRGAHWEHDVFTVHANLALTMTTISQALENLCPVWGKETTTETTTESETEMSNEDEEIFTVTCVRNSRTTATGTVEELESDGWRQIDGDWYSENYWFTCTSCDDSFSTHDQDRRSDCDEPWCENCGSDCNTCDDCGSMITDEYDQVTLRAGRYDYQTYHDDCQPASHFCNHHQEQCVGDSDDCSYCHRNVLSYTTKFDDLDGLFFHHNGDISRYATDGVVYLGVEHEMLNERRSRDAMAEVFTDRINDHYAILKDDGSVGDEGFEYVSQPMTLETHRNFADYWQWVDECKSDGFIAWDAKDRDDKLKCGIHIHVSRTGFSGRSHTARFVLAVYKFQDEMVKFSGRRSKRWADYAEYERMQFVDRAKGMSNPNRYVAVNCQNEHTIELRIFRSSMVKETVLAYMEVTDALVEWTRTLSCRDHYDGKFDFAQFREWLNDKPQYAHCADRIDRRVTRVITEV